MMENVHEKTNFIQYLSESRVAEREKRRNEQFCTFEYRQKQTKCKF